MSTTDSSHAGADLRVGNVKISSQFIEALNDLQAPLPWDFNEFGFVIDANHQMICNCHDMEIASMIVLAVNTCGSFRATTREEGIAARSPDKTSGG